MKKVVSLLLLFSSLGLTTSFGQYVRLFDVDNELSSSLVNYLFQDSYGLMWVATEEGLNCYDGNKFRQFRHNASDEASICSNYVNSLFETDDRNLLVCTNRGIQIFDPVSRNFSKRIPDQDGKEFTASVVQAIKRNNGEFLLVGDSIRILREKDMESNETPHLIQLSKPYKGLEHIHCGIADSQGNIWLSQNERGLFFISKDDKIKHYFGDKNDPSVSCMTLGKDGLLYLGTTSHGLLRFNPDNSTFENLSPSTGKEIKSLFVEKNGCILQATDGTGIIVYDPITGDSYPMQFGNRFVNSSDAKTHCLLRDNCNNLWVGMFQTGVIIVSDNYNSFDYMGVNSEKNNVIGDKCVSAICKDSQGVLWIGADNDGIYALDEDLKPISHFYNDDISVPMCIFEDSKKNLWVGTYLSGVGMIDKKTGKMNKISMPVKSEVPPNMCFAITEDRDHNIWLGMLHSGLIRYNLNNGETSIDFPWRNKIDPFIASLYYSGGSNSLYIGTFSGMQIVNNLSQNHASVKRILKDYIVYSIDEDNNGTIWVGTTNGLVSFNPKTGEEIFYGVEEGLPSTTVYAVSCEGKNVWMSSNNGISRLDTQTGKIVNYFVGDGLQGNEYYKNSVFKDSWGHIFFGGTGGVTHFNPNEISNPGKVWTPRIVDIYTHGEPLKVNDVIYSASKLNLSHDENSFSVEFGTSELGRPQTVRFAYSIDGKPWELLPQNTNTVNFYDLDPGKHTLSFRAIDGLAESPVKTVSLAVAHPWYSSPLAIVAYFILIALLLWSGFQNYVNRMQNRARLLELQHSDQLNEARLRSYVNISHEIRTPMSLVISPLQKLLANDDNEGRQREYRLILRNAKRVIRLIDELMDLRKIEKHQMNLTFKKIELVPFIQDICDTFAQALADKNQSLEFKYSDINLKADIDPANFDKILMNLFSNAVKYTQPGGDIKISLTNDKDNAIIKFTDTGIGISDEDKKRIFERFYQVKGNVSSGSGVGLHLTQQLVTLHGGTISVEDNPSKKGTCFILTIPLHHNAEQETRITDLSEDAVNDNHHKEILQQLQIPVVASSDSKKPSNYTYTVLVVEDDEEIKEYLKSELSSNYKVITCSNGKEALDIIFKNAPDLILSDIMMPEMDGLELTRTIKQNINLNHIPIILLTALTRDEDNLKAITAGADSYFTKPFNMEIVRERVAALLQRYRELKNKYSGNQEYDDQIDEILVESADEKLIRRIVTVINRKLNDPELSVEKLASEVGLSRVHLHRKLKELTNQSPSDFIRNTRLRQAAHLLKEKKLSVAEVAYATGFNSTSTFSTSFKKLYGVTPSSYGEEKQLTGKD